MHLINFFEEPIAEGVVDLVEGVDDFFGFMLVLHDFWNADDADLANDRGLVCFKNYR